MLSIIIPAMNEEKYLPLLLDSIKKQDFTNYEIIVADAGSKDKTLEIAKKYNCKIVSGGLPAKGRNEGAKIADGGTLFFLDADTLLPDSFFDKSLSEFKNRNLDIASFCIKSYPENKFIDFLLKVFYNKPMIFLEKILAHAAIGILVKKDLFGRLNGFDETIKLAEDHDFARRAGKIANFGIIRSVELYSSDRRAKADGWFTTSIKLLLCELHMIFIGPVRSNIFKYRFGHYDNNDKNN